MHKMMCSHLKRLWDLTDKPSCFYTLWGIEMGAPLHCCTMHQLWGPCEGVCWPKAQWDSALSFASTPFTPFRVARTWASAEIPSASALRPTQECPSACHEARDMPGCRTACQSLTHSLCPPWHCPSQWGQGCQTYQLDPTQAPSSCVHK